MVYPPPPQKKKDLKLQEVPTACDNSASELLALIRCPKHWLHSSIAAAQFGLQGLYYYSTVSGQFCSHTLQYS